MNQDVDRCIKNRQFHEAARRAIRTGRSVPDGPVVKDLDKIKLSVSEIVMKAIAAKRATEVAKIMREYEEFVLGDARGAAVTFLNEETVIDLQPDVL